MYFTLCSSVSIVNFEHVIAGWVGSRMTEQLKTVNYFRRNLHPKCLTGF